MKTKSLYLISALFFLFSLSIYSATSIDVKINDNGSLTFFDKEHQVTWGSNIPGWVTLQIDNKNVKLPLTSSVVKVTKNGESSTIQFNGLKYKDRIIDFEMEVKIAYSNNKINVEVFSLKSRNRLHRLEYPAALMAVKSGVANGSIVIPRKQGIMIPSRYDAGYMRYGQNVWGNLTDIDKKLPFESFGINMPWFGASLGNSSIFARVLTPADCQLHVVGNSVVNELGEMVKPNRDTHAGERMSTLSPIWDSQKGELGYARKISVELVSGGYVGMAKCYLGYAKETGRYVTFKDKIKRNPDYAKIIGAPDLKIYIYTNRIDDPYYTAGSGPVLNGYERVHTTFDQVGEMAQELKSMGVDNCLVLLGGWNRAGYDREHVDMWPPAAGAGGVEGMAKACEKVKDLGYLFALHDNYSDFYPDAPSYDEKYIVKLENGEIKKGGTWDGGVCNIICTKKRRELLLRNLEMVLDKVDLNAYYFDVITAAYLMECYDKDHPMTRSEDLKNRLKVINTVRDKGLVFGGEMGTDWATETAVFFEGLHGGGTGYHRGVTYEMGIDIPLYHLVYHDCVVAYWQHGTPFGREDHANHVLHDLICGQPSSWSIVHNQFDDLKTLIKDTYELLGKLHKKTAFHSLEKHEILSNDYALQKSTFGEGTSVIVNYSITTRKHGNVEIPPKGFVLNYSDGKVKSGSFQRSIMYDN